ncbi:MAG: OsmC family protein [Acidobacteria bacterium]|nr:OsmC family protein [Acidobacteriota bacterium]
MKVETKMTNGVDVSRLFETVAAIKERPELAAFQFRITNEWKGGAENQSEARGFYGGGQENRHPRPFSLLADEPAVLLGNSTAPNPVEHLLHALASCVTTSTIYHAAAKGIAVEAVESTLEGDLDLRGFLGLDPSIRNGYRQIRLTLKIKSDATDEQIQELQCFGPTFSPVFDSVTKGVPVVVSTERMK